MHYYQHHIGDFIKDTSYLTNEEVGVYLKLLWLYYDTEKPLPNDIGVLCTKVNARLHDEFVTSILKIFFILEDGHWKHTRCDEIIAEYHKQLNSASKAGKASAAKRAFNARSTSVQPTNNHKPITNNHKLNINTPEGVDASLWNDYLKVRKAAKKPLTDTALKGLIREAEKAKITLSDALQTCCERSWVGFKAEWVKEEVTRHKQLPLVTNEQIEEAYKIECGKDPKLARFGSYYEMKDYVIKQRELRSRTQA